MGELLVTGTYFMGMFTVLLDLHSFVKQLQKKLRKHWKKNFIHCKFILLRLIGEKYILKVIDAFKTQP